MARVTLQNVCKVYPGGVTAVDRVSLDIADEQFVVLVGPSGCGKSTTLRMVAGLEEISSGSIEIGGRVVNDVPPKDRDIAMVFQNYALYPHMSVYKNMAFSLTLRRRELGLKKADIDRKVREAAKILGIEALLDRKPKALSGGQRQRVAVGRAIVRDPKAFLFDEPLSNVDAKMRVEMRSEIKKLQRRLKTTTIYVTHDQEEAMTLGDQIVVMKDGRVQQVGSPLEIFDRPVNRFVGDFIGTPPMNFLDGRIVGNGRLSFDEGSAKVTLGSRLATAAEAYRGRDMVLGIRPEGLSTMPDRAATAFGPTAGTEELPQLDVRVTLVELLGKEKDVHMATSRHDRLVGRMDAHVQVSEGQTMRVFVDLRAAHLFEPGAMGKNVSLASLNEAARAN